MHIIILVLILLLLVVLAQKQPKMALILGAIIAVVGLVIIMLTSESTFRQDRIATDEISIQNPVMLPTYAGDFTLTARLVNQNDKYTLKSAIISIKMLDCPKQGTKQQQPNQAQAKDQQIHDQCQIIGHSNERIHTTIPPQQARDIEEKVGFGQVRVENNLQWQFDITETKN